MIAANPRSRRWRETGKWTGYEVVLDVWPDVFAWGILLVPKDLQPGERRPVVVAQHGLEGLPRDVIRTDVDGFRYYRAFASRLADEGFIVFAPHNPYRGGDRFRVLQRKANPLKLSIFSFIIGQHRRILDWLKTLPWVDGERIGFYGLSYGGKTAMRVPAVLEDYALSICSGDFNQWIWKNVTVEWPNSYMFTGEYEMPEFGLGMSFNYAEMAYLIFPRPFMVERGHGTKWAWTSGSPTNTPRSGVSTGNWARAAAPRSNGSKASTGSTGKGPSAFCAGTSIGSSRAEGCGPPAVVPSARGGIRGAVGPPHGGGSRPAWHPQLSREEF